MNGTAADMVGVFPEGSVVVIHSSLDMIAQLGIFLLLLLSLLISLLLLLLIFFNGGECRCDTQFSGHDCSTRYHLLLLMFLLLLLLL